MILITSWLGRFAVAVVVTVTLSSSDICEGLRVRSLPPLASSAAVSSSLREAVADMSDTAGKPIM